MDPLSGFLELLKVNKYHLASLSLGGEWAFDFPQRGGIKFTAVIKGEVYLKVDGEHSIQHLSQGDCFLMTRGAPFKLFSDPSLKPINSQSYFETLSEREIKLHYKGDDVQLVGGRFEFKGSHAPVLLDMLPAFVHIQSEMMQASNLRWLLAHFSEELRENNYGRSLIAEHYAHIMLVEVLRVHLVSIKDNNIGWFSALADKQLGIAMMAIHNDLSALWSVDKMAKKAHLSRSAFAEKFKRILGLSPMEYLTRWRMLQACNMLKNKNESISTIAFSLGYQSESAFSTAFKRYIKLSPRNYQRSDLENPSMLSLLSLMNLYDNT